VKFDSKKSTSKPTLHELQKWMRWVITDPRGVSDALKEPILNSRAPELNAFESLLDLPPVSIETRLDVYAEGYFARIAESMAQDFPTVMKVLGKDIFFKLLTDYLKEYPSRSFNIGEVGKNLSSFSRTHFSVREFEFLPELVELEWLLIQSFYANDVEPFDTSRLASFSEEDWASVRLGLDSSVFVFKSFWPLDDLWLDRENLESLTPCLKSLHELEFLIYRKNGWTHVERIEGDQAACLESLQRDSTLTDALSVFTDPSVAQQWLGHLMQNGLIKDFRLPEPL
jgi:hypothetical protein